MPHHEDRIRLRHMLDHAREVLAMVDGRSRSDLDTDRQLNLALVRLLEIVGEAANRVSPDTRAHHTAIPWQDIIGLRNRLIHGYDQVDFEILWLIIRQDLVSLCEELERIVPAADGQ